MRMKSLGENDTHRCNDNTIGIAITISGSDVPTYNTNYSKLLDIQVVSVRWRTKQANDRSRQSYDETEDLTTSVRKERKTWSDNIT